MYYSAFYPRKLFNLCTVLDCEWVPFLMAHRFTDLRPPPGTRAKCMLLRCSTLEAFLLKYAWVTISSLRLCTDLQTPKTYLVRLCTESVYWPPDSPRDQGLAHFSWLKYAWVTFSRFVRLCTEPSMSTPKTYLVRLCTEPSMSTPKHILCGCVLNRCTDLRTPPGIGPLF
jgi:hypothetical protein